MSTYVYVSVIHTSRRRQYNRSEMVSLLGDNLGQPVAEDDEKEYVVDHCQTGEIRMAAGTI